MSKLAWHCHHYLFPFPFNIDNLTNFLLSTSHCWRFWSYHCSSVSVVHICFILIFWLFSIAFLQDVQWHKEEWRSWGVFVGLLYRLVISASRKVTCWDWYFKINVIRGWFMFKSLLFFPCSRHKKYS